MRDEQIIKALECCGYDELGHLCAGCPKFDKENDFCQEELHISALDLIKRQKAEIESLKGDIDLYKKIMHNLSKELEESE